MNQKTINDLFADWGREERLLPARNEEIKNKVLTAIKNVPPKAPRAARSMPWTSLVFAGLAVIAFFFTSTNIPEFITSYKGTPVAGPTTTQSEKNIGGEGVSAPSMPTQMSEDAARNYYPPSYPTPIPPVADTREFLKMNYNAAIRTRNVAELTGRVQTTVRGFDGRVDAVNSSPKSAYVSFVIPASKFDAFKKEIESFANYRFIATDVSTENLLPQKQAIEKQRTQIQKSLDGLKTERQQLITAHNQAVLKIQSRLSDIAYELATLQAEPTQDPIQQAQIAALIQDLFSEQSTQNLRLANENSAYAKQKSSLDTQIKNYESSLAYTDTQDQNLLDTVATVRGTITLSWISVWEVVGLYLPEHWLAYLLVSVALVTYVAHRVRARFALR